MSVGHVARAMEESGIATVVIASGVFSDRLRAMHLPRIVLTDFPMGRPLGAPNDSETQREVLLAALDMIDHAKQGGSIHIFNRDYCPWSL